MCGHVQAESVSDRFLDPLAAVLGFYEWCGVAVGPPAGALRDGERKREEKRERERREKERK